MLTVDVVPAFERRPPSVLYVGRAVNVRNRLMPSQHEMWHLWEKHSDEIDDLLDTGWMFIAVWYEPKERLNDAESALLQLLKPRFNRRREFTEHRWPYRVPDLVFDVCTIGTNTSRRPADGDECPLPNGRSGCYAWHIDNGLWTLVSR